jgi:hypothetical protein
MTTASWPLYRGTKEMKACPMTKAEYCLLRGWPVPADEDPAERGYVVEYQDGGKPNLEGYDGYVSWSPADVFERTYKPCGSHVERMEIEHAELSERISKLDDFLTTDTFKALDPREQHDLSKQRNAMGEYRFSLSKRLARATA